MGFLHNDLLLVISAYFVCEEIQHILLHIPYNIIEKNHREVKRGYCLFLISELLWINGIINSFARAKYEWNFIENVFLYIW